MARVTIGAGFLALADVMMEMDKMCESGTINAVSQNGVDPRITSFIMALESTTEYMPTYRSTGTPVSAMQLRRVISTMCLEFFTRAPANWFLDDLQTNTVMSGALRTLLTRVLCSSGPDGREMYPLNDLVSNERLADDKRLLALLSKMTIAGHRGSMLVEVNLGDLAADGVLPAPQPHAQPSIYVSGTNEVTLNIGRLAADAVQVRIPVPNWLQGVTVYNPILRVSAITMGNNTMSWSVRGTDVRLFDPLTRYTFDTNVVVTGPNDMSERSVSITGKWAFDYVTGRQQVIDAYQDVRNASTPILCKPHLAMINKSGGVSRVTISNILLDRWNDVLAGVLRNFPNIAGNPPAFTAEQLLTPGHVMFILKNNARVLPRRDFLLTWYCHALVLGHLSSYGSL